MTSMTCKPLHSALLGARPRRWTPFCDNSHGSRLVAPDSPVSDELHPFHLLLSTFGDAQSRESMISSAIHRLRVESRQALLTFDHSLLLHIFELL